MNKKYCLRLFCSVSICFAFLPRISCFAQEPQTQEKSLEEQARENASRSSGYTWKVKQELDKAEQAGDYERANKLREELIATHRQRRMQAIEDMQFLKEQGKPAVPGEFRKMAPIYEEEKESKKPSSEAQVDTAKTPKTVVTELKGQTLSEKIKQQSLRERLKEKPKEQPTAEKQKGSIKESEEKIETQAEETVQKPEANQTQNTTMPRAEEEIMIKMRSVPGEETPQPQAEVPSSTKTIATQIHSKTESGGEPLKMQDSTQNK